MASAEENQAAVRELLYERDPAAFLKIQLLAEAAVMEQTVLAWPPHLLSV